ncbi:MAG: acyl-CoA dehydratase activase-related protein [Patescibacteria group bacterium]
MKKIGLPRALLYHKYSVFWHEYFSRLGCQLVVSPPTNKEIMARGINIAVDESCLSVKIFLGHVDYLKDKVDYIFIPRIVSLRHGEFLCTKFMALVDIVRNSFDKINILTYTIDAGKFKGESIGLFLMAKQLNSNPFTRALAYIQAKKKYKQHHQKLVNDQVNKFKDRDNSNPLVLIVSHPYTTHDAFLGVPIVKFLESQGVDLVYSNIVDEDQARQLATNLSRDLYWTYHKYFLGAIELYRPHLDGIIFLMTFPCGPDSLVINLCQNKIKDIPIVVITLDELQSEAGLKTRLESFVDILKIKASKLKYEANTQKN